MEEHFLPDSIRWNTYTDHSLEMNQLVATACGVIFCNGRFCLIVYGLYLLLCHTLSGSSAFTRHLGAWQEMFLSAKLKHFHYIGETCNVERVNFMAFS